MKSAYRAILPISLTFVLLGGIIYQYIPPPPPYALFSVKLQFRIIISHTSRHSYMIAPPLLSSPSFRAIFPMKLVLSIRRISTCKCMAPPYAAELLENIQFVMSNG